MDALPGDAAAEPVVRERLERAAGRLRLLCATFLYKSYQRLTRPPLNLETDELLGGVLAALLNALRTVRPQTVRQLNDQARRFDERAAAAALPESGVAAPPCSTGSGLTSDGRRMLAAIDGLPEPEREVFELVGIQGLTYAEAAAVVGVSEKKVRRRLSLTPLLLPEQLADRIRNISDEELKLFPVPIRRSDRQEERTAAEGLPDGTGCCRPGPEQLVAGSHPLRRPTRGGRWPAHLGPDGGGVHPPLPGNV